MIELIRKAEEELPRGNVRLTSVMLNLEKLQSLIGGQWNLQGRKPAITSVAEISGAGPNDIIYAVDSKRVDLVKASDCGLAILPKGDWEVSCPHICVENPYLAFARVLELLNDFVPELVGISPLAMVHPSSKIGDKVQIHPGVVVGRGVKVGSGTILSSNSTIGEDVEIGNNCLVYQNVVIRERCKIGDRVILQPGCVVGSDGYGFVYKDGVHHKIPQIGAVIIGDDVELGANVTVDRGTFRPTIIGKGTKIDNLVQIGHNVVLGDGCLMAAQSGISGTTKVEDFVTFGGQSGSVGHITIGKGSTIFARGVPTQSIKPGSKISGFPGRDHKEDLRMIATIRKLPDLMKEIRSILKTLNLMPRL